MRLYEIIAKPVTPEISYDPAAKKLKITGRKPKFTLKVLRRIKYLRRKQEKVDNYTSGLRQLMYSNESRGKRYDIDAREDRLDQMALSHIKRNQ